MNNFSTYQVVLKVQYKNGSNTDISKFVHDFELQHSVVYDVPTFGMKLNGLVFQYLSHEIQRFRLIITSYIRSSSIKRINEYNLVPANLNQVMSSISGSLSDTRNMNRDFIVYFWVEPCLVAAWNNTANKVYHNTRVQDVLIDITDKKLVEQVLYNKMNTKRYEQIVVAQKPYLQQLDDLDFYFGLTPYVCPKTICPSYNDPKKCIVNIQDVKEAISKKAFQATIFVSDKSSAASDIYQSYITPNSYVCLGEISVKNEQAMTSTSKYITVTKPSNALYSKKQFDRSQVASDYGTMDPTENASSIVNKINNSVIVTSQTGNDNSEAWSNSLFGELLLYGSRTIVYLFEVSTAEFLQPGYTVNIKVKDPKYVKYAGNYMIESLTQRFSLLSSADWTCLTDVSLVRSNTIWS
jgi:hypothetical protein